LMGRRGSARRSAAAREPKNRFRTRELAIRHAQVAAWLSEAGGPTEPESIGFGAEDAEMALHFGPYMRNRFMIARLAQILDMM
jgi:hypothetical protein